MRPGAQLVSEDLIFRLRKRAEIRRQIATRKSVQEGKADRIADLLDEAAKRIEFLEDRLEQGGRTVPKPVRNERACTCPWLEARGTMLHALGCPALVCPTCKGTTRVQILCPDDKPGCLVYHTALCPDCKGWASR